MLTKFYALTPLEQEGYINPKNNSNKFEHEIYSSEGDQPWPI